MLEFEEIEKMRGVDDYPELWRKGVIQAIMYRVANWRCEHCGMAFVPGTTKAIAETNRNGRPVVLTVHHLDGNKKNCTYRNLLVCCQRCHLEIQALWKPGDILPRKWHHVPEWIMRRRLSYREHPQMRLL